MSFWDSSALVPLIVEQSRTDLADAWRQEDSSMVVWTLAGVEITSALWRLVREGALDATAARAAEGLADDLIAGASIVTDVERVKNSAVRLLRVHPLRAADALQLGAALAWADGNPKGARLLTLDERLAAAAQREGFTVPTRPPG